MHLCECGQKNVSMRSPHCNSGQLPIFRQVVFFGTKKDHFRGATSAENRGVHFWKLYNERFRKFENGVGVGVGLAYGAKQRGIERSSSFLEQKNRYLKALFVQAKQLILIQFITYLDGRKNSRLDVCMKSLSIRRSKTNAF